LETTHFESFFSSYQVEIHDVDRRREGLSSYPSSLNVSESEDETASETEELDSIPASQEEEHEDSEGVMPDDFPQGLASPVDDLKTFDWDVVDDELNEFLGSDSENDSDASESSQASVKDSHGRKRNHDEVTDDDEDDSDEGSVTAKKARISNSRSTGLKASHEAESSLPTPGPMDEDDDDDWAGLEADLEAELEKEEEETAGKGG
jgi:RNA polymerase II subunit A-like phosphatase